MRISKSCLYPSQPQSYYSIEIKIQLSKTVDSSSEHVEPTQQNSPTKSKAGINRCSQPRAQPTPINQSGHSKVAYVKAGPHPTSSIRSDITALPTSPPPRSPRRLRLDSIQSQLNFSKWPLLLLLPVYVSHLPVDLELNAEKRGRRRK